MNFECEYCKNKHFVIGLINYKNKDTKTDEKIKVRICGNCGKIENSKEFITAPHRPLPSTYN